MNRALTGIAVVCAAGLALLTACTTGETGSPTSDSTTRTTTETATTSASAKGSGALAGVKPCELLTAQEAGGLGLSDKGEADRIAGSEACDWRATGNGGLLVSINLDQGIADLNYTGATTSRIKVGKFEALRVPAPTSGKNLCDVALAVSDSTSVQVSGSVDVTSTDTAAACERATKAAELIAPKLP
ncbi:DUF3558 domain-containing protein [Actinosynnema sp. CA-248983]